MADQPGGLGPVAPATVGTVPSRGRVWNRGLADK